MKKLICFMCSAIVGLCCISCTDDSNKLKDIRVPWHTTRNYIQDADGNTLYTYCSKPFEDGGVATLKIGETYILKVAYCYMGHDEPSEEWHDAWIENYDKNYLQITRRYDIEETEEIGKYFELKPIGVSTQTSFVIRYGDYGDKINALGKKVEVKIVE